MSVQRKHPITMMGGALILIVCLLSVNLARTSTDLSDPAIALLQEYVRINTTTYNDLTPAVEFWQKLAAAEGLPINVYYMTEGFPIVVIKWAGTNSSAPSIMLNSHMDVVPADEDDGWTYPPFNATLTDDGKIYGRGTQDMKSVAIQYYEALRRLKEDGETWERDIYMTLMPDEEVGASNGMIPFLESNQFAALNVGFEMDEGSSYPIPIVPLFYQDKVVWQIQVDCYGEATHGSTFSETNITATGKCRNVMDSMFEFRDEQYDIYLTSTIENAGIYSSVNLNRMNAGTANNIVPRHVSLVFDIRLGTTVNEDCFAEKLSAIVSGAGSEVNMTYISKDPQSPATLVTDANPYYVAVVNATSAVSLPILALVPPGSTDARHVRNAGIPALGFSPMPNTEMLLHAVNEYIGVDVFLQGIVIYKEIIRNLANIPAEDTSFDPSVYLIPTTL